MPQLSYWLRIKENPSFKNTYSSVVLPMHNGEIIHYTVKLETDLFVSFILPNGSRNKILFSIDSVIGEDLYLVYQFDEEKVTKVYLNAEEVEFIRLKGA